MTQQRLMAAKLSRLWLDTNSYAESLTSRRLGMETSLNRCKEEQWYWIRLMSSQTMRMMQIMRIMRTMWIMIWEHHLICTFSSMKSPWCKILSLKSIMMSIMVMVIERWMKVGGIHLSHLLDTLGLESTSRSCQVNKTCSREETNIRSHLKQWISTTKMIKITKITKITKTTKMTKTTKTNHNRQHQRTIIINNSSLSL